MAKLTLNNIDNESVPAASSTINANNDAIEAALENTLSRDGTSPNAMNANLDMNSYRIINLPAPVGNNDAARLADVTTGADGAKWYSGNGTPSDATGVEGDYYLNLTNGDIYTKGASTWGSSTGNIKGPQGATGSGSGDLLSSNNLSDVLDAATAAQNLNLEVGVDVQAYDVLLQALSAITLANGKLFKGTGASTAAAIDITSAGEALLDDATAADQRTTLGLGDCATLNVGQATGTVAAGDDSRFFGLPLQTQSGAKTFALADRSYITRNTNTGATAWTLPPNSSVAFPIGTVLTVRNAVTGGTVTLTRGAGVSLYIAGSTTSKDVAFARAGWATIIKEDTDVWVVSGIGLS